MAIRYRELERSLNRRRGRSGMSAHTRGDRTKEAATRHSRGLSQSVSRCRSPRHHAPFTPPFQSIRDLAYLTSPLARFFFVLVFLFFFSFFLENSKEVREEGLFLENNLFRFFDIILRGDDFFFLWERVLDRFFSKKKMELWRFSTFLSNICAGNLNFVFSNLYIYTEIMGYNGILKLFQVCFDRF